MASLRVDYETAGIDEADMADDPVDEFRGWLSEAVAAGVEQANTFVLATATPDGAPSARAVLLKDLSESGFVFYTDKGSRKGRELSANPRAAACFVWLGLHRQIRVEGVVEAVDDHTSDQYFATRPPGARLAAAASEQSQVVPDRPHLERLYAALAAQHPDGDLARPEAWGGFRIRPEEMEFWQGRPNRFHDRIRYRRQGSGWIKERLAP